MKKLFLSVLICAIISLCLVGCKKHADHPTDHLDSEHQKSEHPTEHPE